MLLAPASRVRENLPTFRCRADHPRKPGQKCNRLLARGVFGGIVELSCPRCGAIVDIGRTTEQCLQEASELQSRLHRRT